jgi:hypothetical protein
MGHNGTANTEFLGDIYDREMAPQAGELAVLIMGIFVGRNRL